jgi:hypothetical protein
MWFISAANPALAFPLAVAGQAHRAQATEGESHAGQSGRKEQTMSAIIDQVLAEEQARKAEQLAMEAETVAAVKALIDDIPAEVRQALARRAGDTVYSSDTIKCFFLFPLRSNYSPNSWCFWVVDEPAHVSEVKPAFGFDCNGRLVKVVPHMGADEYFNFSVYFSASEATAEDVANWVRRNDGYAESLAKRLQEGLDRTLEALRERRQRISEMKAAAERIASVLS